MLPYLSSKIKEVAVSGESGLQARPCHYSWVLSVRSQCVAKQVPFIFHQTGANFVKNGRAYRILRKHQIPQARKANIDYLPKISCLQQKAAPNFKVPEQNR